MISFFLLVAVLLAVGVVSWFRTGPLRRGAIPQARDPPETSSTSLATYLASMAGVAAAAWGAVVSVGGGQRTAGIPLVVAGLFIAVAGSAARVAGFGASALGLEVRFARGPRFGASWTELESLGPPRTPLGGWRLTTVHGVRSTLMPSDLLGHEDVLVLIVHRAGLRFDGRRWVGGS
jgi:hypothetical protein